MSENKLYPFQRLGGLPQTCDFCSATTAQVYKFDLDDPEIPPRYLLACSRYHCQENLEASIKSFNTAEGRIPLTRVQRAEPNFFSLKFTIRRSSGELDEEWTIPQDWASKQEFSTLQTLRGEPWWRIILIKNNQMRYTFLHELQELNTGKDIDWEAIKSVLPPKPPIPSVFLDFYHEENYALETPSDKDLLVLRK